MTIWIPELSAGAGTKAHRIVEALVQDIARGRLKPGDRLPPQRDLAYRLGLSLGTVTRSYAEARRRGLVASQVGSGTFVRDPSEPDMSFGIVGEGSGGVTDLSANLSFCDLRQEALDEALDALSRVPGSSELMEYQSPAGMARHREAGARWVAQPGFEPHPSRIVVCHGAQQGLAVTLSALSSPGETVLTEPFTFPPVRSLAEMFGIALHGVASDAAGIIPDALDEACRATRARLLYCIPTLQNPTGATMPADRRAEIAAVARRHDLRIVEDDVYSKILDPPALPLAHFAPERTWYVTSTSKTLAPGLRVGYIHSPDDAVGPLLNRIRAFGWMGVPLTAEMAALWIENGTANRLIDWHRRENAARASMARDILDISAPGPGDCPHLWLEAPGDWDGGTLAAAVEARGIRIAAGSAFAVGRGRNSQSVRISLNAARSREELARALRIIVETIAEGPAANYGIL